jgi:hypothetical protein
MKLLHQFTTFLARLVSFIISRKYILSTRMDFLNASEILYIHNAEDPKTGYLYMYINFASHHKLCIMFKTKEEYEETVKKLTVSN